MKTCPKCGSGNILVAYQNRERDDCTCPYSRPINVCPEGEHLHYVCRACQYTISALCKDVKAGDA